MAIRLNGTAFLEMGWTPVTAEPLSLFGMFNPTASNSIVSVISIYANNSGNGFAFSQLGNLQNGTIAARKTINGSDQRATQGLTTSTTWQFGLSVFASTSSIRAFHGMFNQNRPTSGSGTFGGTPNRVNIGCDQDGAGGRTKIFSGTIAECLIVRGFITEAQCFALCGGVINGGVARAISPYDLFPRSAILFYAPLKDNLIDEISGQQLYNGGNPVIFGAHPVQTDLIRRKLYVLGAVNATVNLTGVHTDSAAGTFTPAETLALAGIAGTVAAGSLTPADSISLAGAGSAGTAGTFTPVFGVVLTGGEAHGAAGSVALAIAFGLVGGEGDTGAGSLSPSITFTGTAGASSAGSAGNVGPAIAQGLAGQSAASAASDVAIFETFGLVGASSLAQGGVATGNVAVNITGVQNAASGGDLGSDVAGLPAGVAGIAAAGDFASSVTVGLSGLSALSGTGDLTAQAIIDLLGVLAEGGAGITERLELVFLEGIAAESAVGNFGAGVAIEFPSAPLQAFAGHVAVYRTLHPEPGRTLSNLEGRRRALGSLGRMRDLSSPGRRRTA